MVLTGATTRPAPRAEGRAPHPTHNDATDATATDNAATDNAASLRVARAAGFREVGVERRGTRCADGPHDAVVHDLLPSDLRLS